MGGRLASTMHGKPIGSWHSAPVTARPPTPQPKFALSDPDSRDRKRRAATLPEPAPDRVQRAL